MKRDRRRSKRKKKEDRREREIELKIKREDSRTEREDEVGRRDTTRRRRRTTETQTDRQTLSVIRTVTMLLFSSVDLLPFSFFSSCLWVEKNQNIFLFLFFYHFTSSSSSSSPPLASVDRHKRILQGLLVQALTVSLYCLLFSSSIRLPLAISPNYPVSIPLVSSLPGLSLYK